MVESPIPVIDLRDAEAAATIDQACRRAGFFVISGHGIDPGVVGAVADASRRFFDLPPETKAEVAMARAGRRWRGWFPPGGELTAGVPDGKEGYYFGAELSAADERVRAGLPLHGPNLFPAAVPELGPAVLELLDQMTALGHRLCRLLAEGLGLDPDWFRGNLTADPTILFRVFHYPAPVDGDEARWGVAEHTDYGLLTILAQDGVGGLEVRTPDGWREVPPIDGTFVCNIGDMLERMTGGAYRSTAHRVRRPDRSRLSFPFFFDPSWHASVIPVPGMAQHGVDGPGQIPERWDGEDVLAHEGPYGDYLTSRVARVFPELWASDEA